MTSILGISAYYHDSAAALVVDGEIVAAAQEERFSRRKHDPRYPRNAVDYVLREGGLRLDEVDYVAFYDKPFLKFERLIETYVASVPRGWQSFRMAMPIWIKEKLFQKNMLFKELEQHEGAFPDKRRPPHTACLTVITALTSIFLTSAISVNNTCCSSPTIASEVINTIGNSKSRPSFVTILTVSPDSRVF